MKRIAAELAAIFAAVIAASGRALGNAFVWDDLYVIQKGEVIFDPANIPSVFSHRTMFVSTNDAVIPQAGTQTYRPLTLISFFWDAALSGRDPLAYHVTNLLTHLGCTVGVYFLARRLLPDERRWAAWFGAAWFGLSPLLAEAHVWINGRSDLFCALFLIGSLLAWCSSLERQRPLLLASSALFFLAACLSKEVALGVLPAMALFPDGASLGVRIRRTAPLALAAAIYLAMRTAALSGLHTHGASAQLLYAALRAPTLIIDGMQQLLLPTRVTVRSLVHDYSAIGNPWLWAIAIGVIGAGVVIVLVRKRFPLLAFGLAGAAGALLPVAVITTVLWPGFGRYLYVPAVFLAPAIADVFARARNRVATSVQGDRSARLFSAAALLYLGALGMRLFVWTGDWKDETSLYSSWIAADPDRPHGYGWLGLSALEQGRYADAVPLLAKADELAPGESRFLYSLGLALEHLGDRGRALDVAATGIHRYRSAPEFEALAARNIAPTDPARAGAHIARCLERAPGYEECVDAAQSLWGSAAFQQAVLSRLQGPQHNAARASLPR